MRGVKAKITKLLNDLQIKYLYLQKIAEFRRFKSVDFSRQIMSTVYANV